MSEKAPTSNPPEQADYRAALHENSTNELLSQAGDLAEDRFSVTKNDRLQLKAGTTATDSDGNTKNVGGRFESKSQLEDIVAFEDQIRLGIKAKEIASVTPEIEAALQSAREQIDRLNQTQSAQSTLKEVGVMRRTLIESSALAPLEVGNMTDDDVRELVDYMRIEHSSKAVSSDPPKQPKVFTIGNTVNVKRTSGDMDTDWAIDSISDDGVYRVTRAVGNDGNRMVKNITLADLEAWNTAPDSTPQDTMTPIDAPISPAVYVGRGRHRASNIDQMSDDKESLGSKVKSFTAYLSSRMFEYSSRPSKKALTGLVGATAVLALALRFAGHDSSGVEDLAAGNSLNTPLVPVEDMPGARSSGAMDMSHAAAFVGSVDAPNVSGVDSLADVDPSANYGSEAYRAVSGEGWTRQLTEMNIPKSEIPSLLEKLRNSNDPVIREWVYTMSDGNPGITKPGQISENVLQSIQKLRHY